MERRKNPTDNFDNGYNVTESRLFKSLPPFVQEAVVQSSAVIRNDEELKSAADDLLNGH